MTKLFLMEAYVNDPEKCVKYIIIEQLSKLMNFYESEISDS